MRGEISQFRWRGRRTIPPVLDRTVFFSFQQADEPCLFKVMVGSQSFSDGALMHEYKTRTIDQAPLFVLAASQQLPRLSI